MRGRLLSRRQGRHPRTHASEPIPIAHASFGHAHHLALAGDVTGAIASLKELPHDLLDGAGMNAYLEFCDRLHHPCFAGLEGDPQWHAFRHALFMTPEQVATIEFRIPQEMLVFETVSGRDTPPRTTC